MQIHQVGGLGFDSNIYLIIDEVIALVDAGTGMNFDRVRRNLLKFGVRTDDVDLLINTHCHYDHIGGDHDFISASGCQVAIHELEVEALRNADPEVTLANAFGASLEPIEPTRELRDGDRIELGEVTLEVLHTPGHTRGSICLYDRERRVLFSGDTVFCDGVGRTDLPTGDSAAMVRSLRRLKELGVRRLLPGHGATTDVRGGECIGAALDSITNLWQIGPMG
ncbi:MAG: MBL fold metallo-hydrolase [Hadesarchaea archaeon]|nr:MBL fold metallo-hydrolase [Hadesarchaea archaeon]